MINNTDDANMNAVLNLRNAIIYQAVCDYKNIVRGNPDYTIIQFNSVRHRNAWKDKYKNASCMDDVLLFLEMARESVLSSIEKFINSNWCDTLLTNSDVTRKDMLTYLHRYREKNWQKMRIHASRSKRLVKCVETGAVYKSAEDAAEQLGVGLTAVRYACGHVGATVAGVHLRYCSGNYKTITKC